MRQKPGGPRVAQPRSVLSRRSAAVPGSLGTLASEHREAGSKRQREKSPGPHGAEQGRLEATGPRPPRHTGPGPHTPGGRPSSGQTLPNRNGCFVIMKRHGGKEFRAREAMPRPEAEEVLSCTRQLAGLGGEAKPSQAGKGLARPQNKVAWSLGRRGTAAALGAVPRPSWVGPPASRAVPS